MQLNELINQASLVAGNDNKLAKQLGVSRQKVCNWRAGDAGCGIEYRVLMASMAGIDVDEVIHETLLEKHANTPLGERLLSALGNAAAGAMGIIVTLASAAFFAIPVRVEARPAPLANVDNV
jgi:hypothetical protein